MTMTRVALSILMLGALALTAAAQAPFDYFAIQRDVFAGFAGDEKALARAIRACEIALATNPDHPQALVWHGVASLATARQKPEQRAALMQRAFAEMDRAVALKPDDPGVRIPRGSILIGFARQTSDPAQRQALLERSRSDFQFAFDEQNRARRLDSIGTHPLGELLQGLGDIYSRLGNPTEAQRYYALTLAKLPDTEYAARATEWMMARQPLPPAQTGCIGCHTTSRP